MNSMTQKRRCLNKRKNSPVYKIGKIPALPGRFVISKKENRHTDAYVKYSGLLTNMYSQNQLRRHEMVLFCAAGFIIYSQYGLCRKPPCFQVITLNQFNALTWWNQPACWPAPPFFRNSYSNFFMCMDVVGPTETIAYLPSPRGRYIPTFSNAVWIIEKSTAHDPPLIPIGTVSAKLWLTFTVPSGSLL